MFVNILHYLVPCWIDVMSLFRSVFDTGFWMLENLEIISWRIKKKVNILFVSEMVQISLCKHRYHRQVLSLQSWHSGSLYSTSIRTISSVFQSSFPIELRDRLETLLGICLNWLNCSLGFYTILSLWINMTAWYQIKYQSWHVYDLYRLSADFSSLLCSFMVLWFFFARNFFDCVLTRLL